MDATTTQLDIALTQAVFRADDDLVADHLELVERIARRLARRLPSHVDVDDLVQAGMVGLIEATRNFDSSQGASFSTFASIRVRGAMLDELRRADWAPRSLRRRSRDVAEAAHQIERRTGGEARPAEIAAELGMPAGSFQKLRFDLLATRMRSLEDATCIDALASDTHTDGMQSPHRSAEAGEARRDLLQGLNRLDERTRDILARYYAGEQSLRVIGEAHGISESRVCQIHARALERLGTLLRRLSDLEEGARVAH